MRFDIGDRIDARAVLTLRIGWTTTRLSTNDFCEPSLANVTRPAALNAAV